MMDDHVHDPFADEPGTLSFFSLFALVAHVLISGSVCGVLVAIWGLTKSSGMQFWPSWVIVVALSFFAMHVLGTMSVRGLRGIDEHGRVRALRVRDSLTGWELTASFWVGLAVMVWGVWLVGGDSDPATSPPWPIWPTLAFALLLVIHGALAFVLREGDATRERVERLTATRAGVVEAQELELRRIERDLHDGAQARLVALNMQLGMVEQQIEKSPERARELLGEARANTTDALRELRDLARGIYPPVLADRGLVAAVESLVAASPLVADVDAPAGLRLPAAVEGALYFTVAESLANAGKHAQCMRVRIVVRRGANDVVVSVIDDGVGGANPEGSGLIGIRQRLEALDGRLDVTSPAGGPTIVRAELPCASS